MQITKIVPALYDELFKIILIFRKEDVRRAVLIGACNIYHMTGHNFLHEKEPGILKALCKSAIFVLQAKHFCDTGVYIEKKADLLSLLSAQDKEILDLYHLSKTWSSLDREEHKTFSNTLLRWSSQLINDYAIA